MRTYYIFKIDDKIKNSLFNNQEELYKLLYDMYLVKDIKYEVSLFNKICNLIDVDVISNYMLKTYDIKKHNNKYLIANYLVELHKSHIVIKSNVNIPNIFKPLNIYSKNFFVVDFNNHDYFWLNEMCNLYCKL